MKSGIVIIAVLYLSMIVVFTITIADNKRLKNEITVLKSNKNAETIHIIDSIKSCEFEVIKKEFEQKDSIYNSQIKILQDENKRIKTNYNRLYNNYSDIIVERPRW
jgi:hypothetical protein